MSEPGTRAARWAILAGALLFALGIGLLVLLARGSGPDVSDVAEPSVALTVVGDFGTSGEDELEVAEQMRSWVESNGADALVTTGDNIYPVGDPAYFEAAWDEPYGWTESAGLEVYASLGNHDYAYEGGAAVVDHLEMPGIWYRQRIGNAELFVLDANRVEEPDQTAWLERALVDSSARWKIAVFHHPAYSCANHGSTEEVVDEWVPLFEEGNVDLVLNGHDHNYQRFVADEGPDYVVTGGGGAKLYSLKECAFEIPERVEANDSDHHFLYLEADGERIRGRAISSGGDILDDFEIP